MIFHPIKPMTDPYVCKPYIYIWLAIYHQEIPQFHVSINLPYIQYIRIRHGFIRPVGDPIESREFPIRIQKKPRTWSVTGTVPRRVAGVWSPGLTVVESG